MQMTRYALFDKVIRDGGHTLIGGATGSGKSVLINGLILTAICEGAQLMLLDPKGGVEFGIYRDCAECIGYAGDLDEFGTVLRKAVDIMEKRFKTMTAKRQRLSTETPIYIIVDEYADMMSDAKKELQPLLLKLARKGRAANIKLILATQSPYKSIITGDIKGNMQTSIALRVKAPSYSRLIIEEPGAEELQVGECMICLNGELHAHKEQVPMYSDELLETVALMRTPPSKRWKALDIA